MGWISMGVGMAVSNARYKKRQREAEMLLLAGDEDVTHVTQDTVDKSRTVL